MLVILTKKPKENALDIKYYLSEIKYFLKKRLRGIRGPQAVINNLLKGLDELGKEYLLDPNINSIQSSSTICVIRDLNALKFTIDFKNRNPKIKIITGPNVITTPNEHNNIISDNKIDKIIVPSQWVKDFYLTFNKNIESKIKIWPSGVKVPQISSDKSGRGILYKKNIPDNILKEVINNLNRDGVRYRVLEYGKFRQEDYFKSLTKAPWVIYLQGSESQGLSLFEAWSYNVPTLVWGNNLYEHEGHKHNLYKLSSPYLTEQCGSFFKKDNFKMGFESFIKKSGSFEPKKYVEENFSLKLAAKNFLDIINE